MKKFIALTPLLLAAFIARADVTIEQKIESSIINGTSVTKIKGDMMRIESPAPAGLGSMATIVDLGKGKATTLMAAQKMAMQMDLSAAKQAAEAAAGGQGGAKITPPKSTGQKEKVGEWMADVYELASPAGTMKIWVARDFPNAAAIKEQMNKLSKAAVGSSTDLSQFDLPGMVVKTEITSPQMKMTSTLVSVKEGPVADSEFTVPTGYNVISAPTGAAS